MNGENEFIEHVFNEHSSEVDYKSLLYHVNRTESLIEDVEEDCAIAFYQFKTQLIHSIVKKRSPK